MSSADTLGERARTALYAMTARLPPPASRWALRAARVGYWIATPHRTGARLAHLRHLARLRAQARVRAARIAEARSADAGEAEAGEAASREAKVAQMWDQSPEALQDAYGMYWMGHPMVARRVYVKASGSPDVDPYAHLKRTLEAMGWAFPVDRVLSLGCGHGALERGLAGLGIARRYDGLDLAPGAIAEARRLAAEAGLSQIHYQTSDLEHADLPEAAFDIVFAHQSVHHIEDLDGLFAAARRALKPGGILHLNEFVGPDRFQWTDAQLRHINAFVEKLPARYRRLPSGAIRPPRVRPTIQQMIEADPSEAIRSSGILPAVGRHFRVIELRELGGSLLHDGLGGIAQNFDPASPEDAEHLEAFFALEDRLMAEGVIGSDFVTVTAVRD